MQNKVERAKQFLPFDSLKGFRNMLKNAEKIIETKRELLEEQSNILNQTLLNLEKNMNVTVYHFFETEYVETSGKLIKIDFVQKKIYLLQSIIDFDDIYFIQTND